MERVAAERDSGGAAEFTMTKFYIHAAPCALRRAASARKQYLMGRVRSWCFAPSGLATPERRRQKGPSTCLGEGSGGRYESEDSRFTVETMERDLRRNRFTSRVRSGTMESGALEGRSRPFQFEAPATYLGIHSCVGPGGMGSAMSRTHFEILRQRQIYDGYRDGRGPRSVSHPRRVIRRSTESRIGML